MSDHEGNEARRRMYEARRRMYEARRRMYEAFGLTPPEEEGSPIFDHTELMDTLIEKSRELLKIALEYELPFIIATVLCHGEDNGYGTYSSVTVPSGDRSPMTMRLAARLISGEYRSSEFAEQLAEFLVLSGGNFDWDVFSSALERNGEHIKDAMEAREQGRVH